MRRMKRFLAVTLLAAVVGLGTPTAFADGNAESPGVKLTQTDTNTASNDGSNSILGNAESPGIMATVIIYLGVLI
jgi:hypothetical protein